MFDSYKNHLQFLLEGDAWLNVSAGLLSADAAEDDSKSSGADYVTSYIGSKRKRVDWIWKHTPSGVNSVLDAFSGSSVVSYMFKKQGLRVIANDRLRFSWHVARAIIENDSVTLSEKEIDNLLQPNPKADDFVTRTFKDKYFRKGVHERIDHVRSNIDNLKGFKKDIALFALGRTCMNAAGSFGHFGSTVVKGPGLAKSPEEFDTALKKACESINALVFDNGKENRALNQDISDLLPGIKTDLAYFDPPYATEFSTTNYETAYHFIEGLMTKWKGKTIDSDSKTLKYKEVGESTITEKNAEEFFKGFLESAKVIPNWLISYRDHAFPTESQIKAIISGNGKSSRMFSHDHSYHLAGPKKEDAPSKAKERLFVCSPSSTKSKVIATSNLPENGLIGRAFEISDVHLTSQSESDSTTEPTFEFILAHVGTNKNGDVFLAEELKKACTTIIDKKINLQHDQYLGAVVGKVTDAQWDDSEGGHIRCTGVLFTQDVEAARAAYRLLKEGFIPVVSMECRMEAARCSYCNRLVKSEKTLCVHLKKYHNREYKGKRVTRDMLDITFTGVGLLEGTPADERALITRVAQQEGQRTLIKHERFREVFSPNGIDNTDKLSVAFATYLTNLLEDQDDPDVRELVKQSTSDFTSMANDLISEAAKKPFRDDLAKENEQLKKQVEDLTKQLEEISEAEKKKAKSEAAHSLIDLMKKSGRTFEDEAAEKAELDRLQSMSEDTLKELKTSLQSLKAEASEQDDSNGVTRTNGVNRPHLIPDETPGGIGDLRTTIRDGLKHSYARFKSTADVEEN